MQMYDPSREYKLYKSEIDTAILDTVAKGDFIGGGHVRELETQLQAFTGAKHAITCANGTDAIFIALKALNIGPGDEVLTVALTWISSAETISMTGAKPVWVDVNPSTFCIDESLIEIAITERTRAMVIVSLYGGMPDYERIYEIAQRKGIYVIEDGAQSFGSERDGYKSCSAKFSTIATTSFFPTKPLGCYGDGGCMFTNNDELSVKLRSIKSHGGMERFRHKYIGVNSRLDTLQASILLVKMKRFEECLMLRGNCAKAYTDILSLNDKLTTPQNNLVTHAFAQYSVLAETEELRDKIVNGLKTNGINVSIFYPVPLYVQECFNPVPGFSLRNTEDICKRIFNLPCYGYVTTHEIEHICNIINAIISLEQTF